MTSNYSIEVDVEDVIIDQNELSKDNTPLWRFVTKLGKASESGGGNYRLACCFCNKQFTGSYSRVKAHLLKLSGFGVTDCKTITIAKRQELSKLESEALHLREIAGKKTMIPLPLSSSTTTQSFSLSNDSPQSSRHERSSNKRRNVGGQRTLDQMHQNQVKKNLDAEIARMFYSGGLSFNFAHNPYYKSSYNSACKSGLTVYTPPLYHVLRTRLLKEERDHISTLLEPIRTRWKDKGVSIVCDGWTDPQRRPLINFIAINEDGPMFLRAVNCEGEVKDHIFIANLMNESILSVGADKVVQIITDNAAACRLAGLQIEKKYPQIYWTPCVVHTINLVIKKICAPKNTSVNAALYKECEWISKLLYVVTKIRNFITSHSMRYAMFNKFSKLKLLRIADTRFASMIVMLKRFREIKVELQSMVISPEWLSYRNDDVAMAQMIKDQLVSDILWDQIDYVLAFTKPLYEMIRICDTDKAYLHTIIEMWSVMMQRIKTVILSHEETFDYDVNSFWNVVYSVMENKRKKCITPLHALAHSLNPRCLSEEWQQEHPYARPPHLDEEICDLRKQCIRRIVPNDELRTITNLELADFWECAGKMSDFDSISDRNKMDPRRWWVIHGSCAPNIQRIAIRLLGQVSSSSCCERNWSTYAFIQSAKRNKISAARADDLVYVHNNLRLLSRKTSEYLEGSSKFWDVGGDGHESLEEVGILEIANLSLDDPELESMMFPLEEDI